MEILKHHWMGTTVESRQGCSHGCPCGPTCRVPLPKPERYTLNNALSRLLENSGWQPRSNIPWTKFQRKRCSWKSSVRNTGCLGHFLLAARGCLLVHHLFPTWAQGRCWLAVCFSPLTEKEVSGPDLPGVSGIRALRGAFTFGQPFATGGYWAPAMWLVRTEIWKYRESFAGFLPKHVYLISYFMLATCENDNVCEISW